MTTITLETIKAEHNKIGALIAAFEAQPKTRTIVIPEAEIQLKDGERYAGIIVGKDGQEGHHLILLPGEAENIAWHDAKGWAVGIGGELPTRREQALLYANLKDEFKTNGYWSCEQHASDSVYAWYQLFNDGYQDYTSASCELRARAVRRLKIQ